MSTNIAKKQDLRTFLSSEKVSGEIAKALPSICKPETFMRVAMTSITKTPKLQQCDQTSFITCLLDCAQLGIVPDGRLAHLIPYGTKCTLILDYKGLISLVRRSGDVVTIHADQVCKNDVFKVNMGEIQEHTIDYSQPRGEVYAFYAYAKMKDGSKQTEVMTLDEVNAIKARSKSSGSGPWKTDFVEMGKKTVFRRLSKWLPMPSEVATKLDEVESREYDFEMPKQADVKVQSELLGGE